MKTIEALKIRIFADGAPAKLKITANESGVKAILREPRSVKKQIPIS